MQEAGASADLELGYTLADGLEYIRTGIAGGPGYRHLRAAAQLLLGHRHEPLHGDRQDARGARAVGQDHQGLPSEESEVDGAAHALADFRLEPDGAGRLQQRAAHLRGGAGRGARPHAVAAYQRARRGDRAAHGFLGAHRAQYADLPAGGDRHHQGGGSRGPAAITWRPSRTS